MRLEGHIACIERGEMHTRLYSKARKEIVWLRCRYKDIPRYLKQINTLWVE
jgi:hypothetical protein